MFVEYIFIPKMNELNWETIQVTDTFSSQSSTAQETKFTNWGVFEKKYRNNLQNA